MRVQEFHVVRLTVRVPERRKMRAAVGAAALFVVASGFVLSAPAPRTAPPVSASGATPGAAGTPASGASGSSTSSSSPSSSSVMPPSVSPTAAGPVATVTNALPTTAGRGILVVATPMADRSLSVTETAVFTVAQHQVTLTPPVASRAGIVGRHFKPVAKQVQLTADGVAVKIGDPTVATPRTVALAPAGVHLIQLRYVLVGALTRAGDTATGSAAQAMVQTLVQGVTQQLDVSYVVSSGVTTFDCPELAASTQAACRSGSGRSVAFLSGLPASHSLLVVTLGDPPADPPAQSTGSPLPTDGTPPTTPSGSSTTTPDVPVTTTEPPVSTGTDSAPPTDTPTSDPTVPPTETSTDSPTDTPTEPPTGTDGSTTSPVETSPPAGQVDPQPDPQSDPQSDPETSTSSTSTAPSSPPVVETSDPPPQQQAVAEGSDTQWADTRASATPYEATANAPTADAPTGDASSPASDETTVSGS